MSPVGRRVRRFFRAVGRSENPGDGRGLEGVVVGLICPLIEIGLAKIWAPAPPVPTALKILPARNAECTKSEFALTIPGSVINLFQLMSFRIWSKSKIHISSHQSYWDWNQDFSRYVFQNFF